MGDDNGESRRYVRHESRGLEGVAQGVQAGEGSGREKMISSGAADAGDVQGREGASGDSLGKDGLHPEMEGRLQGHRVGRGTAESLCRGG